MMCGADIRTAIVATIVKNVKIIRHSLSTTIAAYFQSFATPDSSSSFRICVIVRLVDEKKERERMIVMSMSAVIGSIMGDNHS